VQTRPQQSPSELQFFPSGRQAAVQTLGPLGSCGFGRQWPRQQSPSVSHGLDRSRQFPRPRSQRPVLKLQNVEQQRTPPSRAHPSPLGRQDVAGSAHPLGSQRPEQQALSALHGLPAVAQIGAPQTPPLQPSEQHSLALWHHAPSGIQNGPHSSSPMRPVGSQRPLQQLLLVVQGLLGARQVPTGRQSFWSHRPEQQSVGDRHGSPCARHAKATNPRGTQFASAVRRASLAPSRGAPSEPGLRLASREASAVGDEASDPDPGEASSPLSKFTSSPHAARSSARETDARRRAFNRSPARGGHLRA
jgi:hypothetical protein